MRGNGLCVVCLVTENGADEKDAMEIEEDGVRAFDELSKVSDGAW